MKENLIEEIALQLIRKASIVLPKDVKSSLQRAYEEETSNLGKTQLKAILDNVAIAERLNSPVCQDTGIVSFFVKGRNLDYKVFGESLKRATIRATEEVPLRPNAVHPLTRKNSGNNTGLHIPGITFIYDDADHVDVTVTLKGGGSENMSVLYMIPPGEGVEGVKRVVLETIVNAGGQPCPPTVVNIGIGGTVDLTFKLAKMAMIRPLGVRHPEEEVARLEREILDLVNSTGIGPMGLGGKTTSLDVKIEYAHCHTASLPVGINLQCWADRRATARIYPDGSWKILD